MMGFPSGPISSGRTFALLAIGLERSTESLQIQQAAASVTSSPGAHPRTGGADVGALEQAVRIPASMRTAPQRARSSESVKRSRIAHPPCLDQDLINKVKQCQY